MLLDFAPRDPEWRLNMGSQMAPAGRQACSPLIQLFFGFVSVQPKIFLDWETAISCLPAGTSNGACQGNITCTILQSQIGESGEFWEKVRESERQSTTTQFCRNILK